MVKSVIISNSPKKGEADGDIQSTGTYLKQEICDLPKKDTPVSPGKKGLIGA